MEREIWTQKIRKWSCPSWPCPVCRSGILDLVKNSLTFYETTESKRKSSLRGEENEFENFEITYSFTAWAECKQPTCKQRFSISGIGGVEPEPSPEGGHEWEDYFLPLVCYPMPDIIKFPIKCPVKVKEELRAAFSIFWLHPDACAGRIRVALEYLMDHFDIPRKGNFNLQQRLDDFAKKNSTMSNQLESLKWLGNTGSHERKVTKGELLDAFEIFEYALIELIDNRSVDIAEKAQNLIDKHKPVKTSKNKS